MLAASQLRSATLAFSLVAAAVVAAPAASAAEDAHHHASGSAKLVLNHGQKWPTDEPLRRGMGSIRAALAADLESIHHNRMTPKRYDALAGKLSGEVAAIVRDCKLEKDADEQLHVVIAEILAGAEAMQGKDKGVARRKGAERVAGALNQYGKFFAHPGWRNL